MKKCINGSVVDMSPEEVAEYEAFCSQANSEVGRYTDSISRVNAQLVGIEFDGVMCSATAEDMFGLSSVTPYIKGGMDLPPFRFSNGNALKLTQTNIAEFEAVWIPFRASFF